MLKGVEVRTPKYILLVIYDIYSSFKRKYNFTKFSSRWTADRLRGSSCLRDPMGWGRDGGNALYSDILPGSRQTTNPTLTLTEKEKASHALSAQWFSGLQSPLVLCVDIGDVIFRKMTNPNQTGTYEMATTETRYQTDFLLFRKIPIFNQILTRLFLKYR